MEKELSTFSIIEKIYHSDSNFLLVKTQNPTRIYNHLVKEGIIVRDRSRVPLCEGCLRITIGTKKENDLLLEKLKTFSL